MMELLGKLLGDLFLIVILWAGLMVPFKSVVKKIAGKERYLEIRGVYNRKSRDRVFGLLGMILGIMGLLAKNLSQAIPPPRETHVLDQRGFAIFAFGFICAGMYCYLMGFVKAMATVIKKYSGGENL